MTKFDIETFLKEEKEKRSLTQMTLGQLIEILEAMLPNAPVAKLVYPHSYRGYYTDLAFKLELGTQPASELLDVCKSVIGDTFTGYKGGEYKMEARTPVWIAEYGSCGEKLIALLDGGAVETKQNDY